MKFDTVCAKNRGPRAGEVARDGTEETKYGRSIVIAYHVRPHLSIPRVFVCGKRSRAKYPAASSHPSLPSYGIRSCSDFFRDTLLDSPFLSYSLNASRSILSEFLSHFVMQKHSRIMQKGNANTGHMRRSWKVSYIILF